MLIEMIKSRGKTIMKGRETQIAWGSSLSKWERMRGRNLTCLIDYVLQMSEAKEVCTGSG